MTSHMEPATVAQTTPRQLFGHPTGLGVLIALKVWELFSYQGMRAFLVFYLIAAFGMRDREAALLYGSYAALALVASVLGGYCADRWLGARDAMGLGAAIIMLGHLTLALESVLGALRPDLGPVVFQLFCLGLGLIAVGTGLLKPNVLAMIGALYRREDPRRDVGYAVYYLGVNVGSLAAPLVCGAVAARFGWGWGFASAAIGMALGLAVFIAGRRHVPADAPVLTHPRRARVALGLAAFAAAVACAWLVQHGVALGVVLAGFLLLGAGLLLARARASDDPADVPGVWAVFLLFPIPVMFQALAEQLATTVNLYVARSVDLTVGALAISAPQLLSLNSFFVLLLLPAVTAAWTGLARRGRDVAPFHRFAIGFALIAAAFLLLQASAAVPTPGGQAHLGWIVGAYLALTLGELCIAPSVFALVGRLVPERLTGVAMGLTLLGFACGNLVAPLLTGLLPQDLAGAPDSRAAYGAYFGQLALAGLAAGALAIALGRLAARRPRAG